MIAIGSREAVIQNLKDAGCETEMIQDFLGWFDKGQQEKQLELLEHQRKYLLGRVHTDERRISCLDYLVYQIQGKPAGKRKL
jgi:hypothetical protein